MTATAVRLSFLKERFAYGPMLVYRWMMQALSRAAVMDIKVFVPELHPL